MSVREVLLTSRSCLALFMRRLYAAWTHVDPGSTMAKLIEAYTHVQVPTQHVAITQSTCVVTVTLYIKSRHNGWGQLSNIEVLERNAYRKVD